jgi:hypothetical protein
MDNNTHTLHYTTKPNWFDESFDFLPPPFFSPLYDRDGRWIESTDTIFAPIKRT